MGRIFRRTERPLTPDEQWQQHIKKMQRRNRRWVRLAINLMIVFVVFGILVLAAVPLTMG
jgi:hypothetical protein